jgi:membrane-associated phospholipid phosphatase
MDNLVETFIDFIKKEVNKVPTQKVAKHLLVFLVLVFLLITSVILIYSPEEFEAVFSRRLQERRHPLLDFYMKFISFFGQRYIPIYKILIVAAVFLLFGYIKEGIFMLLTSIASIFNMGLKLLINRPRPSDELVEILIHVQYQSFPSGHVVHYVVFFGMLMVLVLRIRKIKAWIRVLIAIICLNLILSVPFSRVYLGAHWISDVTAGFIAGILMLTLFLYLYFKNSGKEMDTGPVKAKAKGDGAGRN